jgi:glycosyltransferase involved in cell wall biosynthesis
MKIAQIAPLWYPIPPERYGGTEKVIHHLTEGLVQAGHDVTLFAAGDSKTSAKLSSTSPTSLVKAGVPWRDSFANLFNFAKAMERADEFDVVHSHMHLNAAFFSPFIKTPLVHTMHNIPGRTDWRWNVFREYKDIYNPIFISQKQKQNTKTYSGIDFARSWVVYNSTDTDHFTFNETPGDYFIWLGLITRVKGIENAIFAAQKAGVKLKIAGKPNEHDTTYFDRAVAPHLRDNIEYVGDLGGQELVDFYRNAKALIYPIEWEEPFGLVMTEAMSCGTPVITYPRGAAPELVVDGKTGFIVDSIEGIVEAIGKIGQISRADCRQRVKDNFSVQSMVSNYIKVYEELLG